MIVIGIDTAIRRTGYGIIEVSGGSRLGVIDCGVIKNPPSIPHSECLRRLAGGMRELINSYHPEAASIESVFVNKNIKTAMILSLARGAVIATLAEKGIPVYEYSPKTAKRSAVGSGDASKEQVAALMSAILGIDVVRTYNDSTDALALALCHANIAAKPELASLMPKTI